MAANEAQRRQAADPASSGATLMALAGEPELWPLLAANPATYDDLIAYLREHGGPDVRAVLDARGRQAPSRPPSNAARSRRLRPPAIVAIVLVGILVLLGVAAAIAIPVLKGTTFSPQTVASEYVDHIAKGEFGAATALVGASVKPELDQSLVTAPGVQLAAGITAFTFGQQIAVPGTDRVTLQVQYSVGDADGTGSVTLEPAASVALVFNTWRIVETTLVTQIDVSTAGAASITIGGIDIPLPDTGVASIAAYPAQYRYAVGGSTWFDVAGDTDVIDTTQADANLTLTTTPTRAFQDEVDQQVRALLTTCLEAEFGSCRYISDLETGASRRCFSYWSLDPDYVRAAVVRLDRVPRVVVDGTYHGGSLGLSSTDTGSATLTWEERELYPDGAWEGCQANVALDFYGEVTVTGEQLAVQ